MEHVAFPSENLVESVGTATGPPRPRRDSGLGTSKGPLLRPPGTDPRRLPSRHPAPRLVLAACSAPSKERGESTRDRRAPEGGQGASRPRCPAAHLPALGTRALAAESERLRQ